MSSKTKKSFFPLIQLFLCVAIALFLTGLSAGFAHADDSQQTPNLAAGSVATAASSNQAVSEVPYEGDGIFFIHIGYNADALVGMSADNRVNNVPVVVCPKKNTNLRRFQLVSTGIRGEYFIKNVATGRLMTVDTNTASGSGVTMQTDNAWDSQKWAVTVNADNTVSFTNILTKTMLTVAGGTPISGVALNLQKAEANTSQRFSLIATKRNKNEKVQINVPCKKQNPQLPTGCESVALVNALNYWGFHLSKTSIAKKWMPYGRNGVYNFIGNPRNSSGWIICAPGIAKTANKFLKSKNSNIKAIVVKGKGIKKLRKYLDQGYPVIVWTTIGMGDPGRLVTYRSGYPLRYNNHAVVLSGYNPKTGAYKVSDSLRGKVWRSSKRFTYLYNKMGKQAVVLVDNVN